MLKDRQVWVDGKLIAFNKATVHIMSQSFCRGSAIFEVMSCYPVEDGPAVFRLNEHIERLCNSAEFLEMKLPLSKKALKEAVLATVKANKLDTAIIKLMCYYAGVEFEVIPNDKTLQVAIVVADPSRDLSERYQVVKNTTATISKWRKLDPRTVPVSCKASGNYLSPMVAKLEARSRGFGTPVLLDTKGYLAEGATESLFIVKNGQIKTPALGNILPGITRASVIELARDIGITVTEKLMRPKELLQADEAFFTTTPIKIWPIEQIENRKLSAPGVITRLLRECLKKICQGQTRRYKKWLTLVR